MWIAAGGVPPKWFVDAYSTVIPPDTDPRILYSDEFAPVAAGFAPRATEYQVYARPTRAGAGAGCGPAPSALQSGVSGAANVRADLRARCVLAEASPASNRRAAHLMERDLDRPIDLADATLVVLAEERGLSRIFTLDSDFDIYRINGRKRFDLIPT